VAEADGDRCEGTALMPLARFVLAVRRDVDPHDIRDLLRLAIARSNQRLMSRFMPTKEG
jgi:hypothetical protein